MMPELGFTWLMVHRGDGLGSLGRERCVALAEWRGGSAAREVKALALSACVWAEEGKGTAPILYQQILDCSVRCRAPSILELWRHIRPPAPRRRGRQRHWGPSFAR